MTKGDRFMALRGAVMTRGSSGSLTISPDPIIAEKGDTLVWICRDGQHMGRFDADAPSDPAAWAGPINRSSQPVLTIKDVDGHFPYTVTVQAGSGGPPSYGHSEVVVIRP